MSLKRIMCLTIQPRKSSGLSSGERVNPEGIRGCPMASGLTSHPILLTLGRLDPHERYKGIDEVIECLPEIGKAIPGVTYLVVGDGDDRPRLVAKACSLGLRVDDYPSDLQNLSQKSTRKRSELEVRSSGPLSRAATSDETRSGGLQSAGHG